MPAPVRSIQARLAIGRARNSELKLTARSIAQLESETIGVPLMVLSEINPSSVSPKTIVVP